MEYFIQQLTSGLANGAIYASVALALVMIFTATEHINFAQGEMAMFSTYVAWQLIDWGVPYWVTFVLTIGISFVAGFVIERVLLRTMHDKPVLSIIIVFIGLLAIFNSVAGFVWSYIIKEFPTPFPKIQGFAGGLVGTHELTVVVVTLIVLTALYFFFRFTSLGLAMRAAAQNPVSAKLVGVRVGLMLALGWGLAAAVGSVAGMMVAPIVFLDPNMMAGILLYGFASALVGGISNPGGAVIGGFLVGVIENLAGTYVVGNDLRLTVALVIVIAVLMFKPAGLFGAVRVRRV